MGVSWADNSVKIWRNLPIYNPKPDLHNNNALTKFGENPLIFTQGIIRKRKMADWRTDRHTDVPLETIIPAPIVWLGIKSTLLIIRTGQGPVVQSVVSLTSSLKVISLTVLADSIYNILIFFAEKMWVSLDVNFNESLTNDIVSFKQLGPGSRIPMFWSGSTDCFSVSIQTF